MKFIIILAIAIFAVNASPVAHNEKKLGDTSILDHAQFGIFDDWLEVIEEIIKKTEEVLQRLLNKLEEILQNVSNAIQKLIDASKAAINEITKKILEKLDEIAKQSDIAEACVEKYRPDLDVAIAEFSLEIQACQDNAVQQTQNIRNDLKPYVDQIHQNFADMRNAINECWENSKTLIQFVFCIKSKVETINNELIKVLGNIKDLIATADKRASEIIVEADRCVNNAETKFHNAVEQVFTNVGQCIKDGNAQP